MDNQRVFIWIALAALLWMNFMQWQQDYAPKAVTSPATANSPAAPPQTESMPELPQASTETSPSPAPAATSAPLAPATTAPAAKIRVVTDVLDMDISTLGGELQRADLLKYPKDKSKSSEPVRLFDLTPGTKFVAQSGLQTGDKNTEPTHLTTFEAAATEYRFKPGQTQLEVPLTWSNGQGLQVTKTYIFKAGSYRVDLRYEVNNQSGSDWKGASYVQLVRDYKPKSGSYFNVESNAFKGPALYDGNKYVPFKKIGNPDITYDQKNTNGWMAAVQHHFTAAAVPPEKLSYRYQLKDVPNQNFKISYIGPLTTVANGSTQMFKETLFVGPKLRAQMDTVAEKLYLTSDYGLLDPIAGPLFWVLNEVHKLIGNWGWSIVIVTLLIKLVFYRLTAASGRSMAKMRALAPRIKAVQERYKDDREQLGRQMMEIYKREKVNPLAGCLPMLIQIPFFFAYYWVLLESAEMRQAPFLGWINDLSSRDPFFILPVFMCLAMVGQFRLQPMPSTDPMQAKIFAFMPVVMSATMAFFPAGLVLYWLTNTLLSIAQQWRINKLVALEEKKA